MANRTVQGLLSMDMESHMMKFHRSCFGTLTRTALPCGLFVLLGFGQAAAVPPPRPLEIRLDMASGVVVGQVVRVERIVSPDGAHRTRATLSVKETLKGAPAKTIESAAYYEGLTAGDSGIWLIGADGQIIWPHGHLPEEQKAEVQRILKILADRKWSGELRGIKAWAAVLTPPPNPNSFVLLFVVKNCSTGDIFLPRPNCRADILTARAKRDDGKEFTFPLKDGEPCKTIHCDRLPAGQLDYLACYWKENTKLLPGKYQVTLTYRNACDGELLTAVGMQAPPVDAWKGELRAPPIELVVPAPEMQPNPVRPANTAERQKPGVH